MWYLRSLIDSQVYLQQNKKKTEAKDKNCHDKNYVESGKADIPHMKNNPHVSFRQITEE